MPKVFVIIGCTASGKGSLGRELARRVGGQIVSVDSMKIYRRMDIGTAKPSRQIQSEIPHHCIDLAEPGESFSVARYVEHADAAIANIRAQGAIPLAVGGTSLYIKALCEGLFDGPGADEAYRQSLHARAASEGLSELHRQLAWLDPEAAARIHPNDAKRIIRALEVHHATGQPISSLQKQWDVVRRYQTVRIGIRRSVEDNNRRINLRAKLMMEAGLVDEVRSLLAEPAGLGREASRAVGYDEIIDHLAGRCTAEQAFERIKINTRQLAKKQRTWHRRWRDVIWFDAAPDETPESLADRVLAEVKFE